MSTVGKISVGLAILIVITSVIFMLSASRNKNALLERAKIIDASVEYASAVCKNVGSSYGEDFLDELSRMSERISAEKDPLIRADMAINMVGLTLNEGELRQDQIDELNGARNRILLAIKEYKS